MSKRAKRFTKLRDNPKNPSFQGAYFARRYKIVLTPEEDGWAAYIPDLPGCVAAGDSPDEALTLIQDAMRSWIEASLERGLPIPEPSA